MKRKFHSGYHMVIAPDDYPGKRYFRGYVYEHHYVWWLNTGNVVSGGFVIHHLNHDKTDNRFENLEILKNADHVRLHSKKASISELICANESCGVCFPKLTRYVNYLKSKGRTEFYCSRKCAPKVGSGKQGFKHGGYSYQNHGCRCKVCTDAHAENARRLRSKV